MADRTQEPIRITLASSLELRLLTEALTDLADTQYGERPAEFTDEERAALRELETTLRVAAESLPDAGDEVQA